jgi:hypothetical protein
MSGLTPIGDVMPTVMPTVVARISRTPTYTAHAGRVCGMFDTTPMTPERARQRILAHAENAIAGVCPDDTALDVIGDLIRAVREAEATEPPPPTTPANMEIAA